MSLLMRIAAVENASGLNRLYLTHKTQSLSHSFLDLFKNPFRVSFREHTGDSK
jgi:hypothetical protein